MVSSGPCVFFDGFLPKPSPSVVGETELESKSVNVRNRDDVGTKARSATIPLADIVDKLVKLKESRSLKNQFIEA